LQYWTPTIYGLSARAGYSLNEGKAAIPGGGGREINPDVLSLSVAYETGLFFVRYAYEQHDDYFGMSQIGGSPGASATNPSSKDKAHKVVAALILPQTRVYGTVERLIYDSDDTAGGAVNHYRRDAYYLQVVQRFGPAGVWGGFGQAFDGECARVGGAACSTNGLGAVLWSIGGLYDFAKRTTIYGSYFSVITGESSSYGIFPAVGTTAPGANSRGLGLGILQIF
jgi:predicted porin